MKELRRFTFLACVLAALAGATTGCGNGDSHEGHDHGDEHDDHDHKDEKGHDDHGSHEGEDHSDEVTLTAEAVRKAGIRIEAAKRHALVESIEVPARVEADLDATAHIGVPVRGRVRDLRVKRGDVVEKGAVLFILESPELGAAQNELIEKRVIADTLGPVVEITRRGFERAKRLHEEKGNMTLTEVERRESDLRSAEAAATTAEAAASTAENALHLLGMDQAAVDRFLASKEVDPMVKITAPLAGTVVDREVTLGELVSPEDESLLVIGDQTVAWVFVHVPEARYTEVRAGAAVRLHVPALAGRVLTGVVAAVQARMDEVTRSAEFRVDVKSDGLLRPGMFARAEVDVGDPKAPVLAVPADAVHTVEGGPAVFVPVAGESDTFAKRAVRVGQVVGGMVPVLEGLVEGESYVAVGAFLLKAELGKAGAAHEH
jgi:cobalt-zinc-cadmium efflux system membrane fusion protein